MVSDFIDLHQGYLKLTDTKHAVAQARDSDFPQTARATPEYGAEKRVLDGRDIYAKC